MATSNSLLRSLKILLMSTGVCAIAVLVSVSMPTLLASATSNLPTIFSTLRSWLQPPYLYFIINAIILTIVATSRLHQHNNHQHAPPPLASNNSKTPQLSLQNLHHGDHHHHHNQHDVISLRADQFSPYDVVSVTEAVVDNVVGGGYYNDVVSFKDVEVEVVGRFADDDDIESEKRVVEESDYEPTTVVEPPMWSTSTPSPPPSSSPLVRQMALEKVSPEYSSARPPASARFANHRRPAKPAPSEGGKALRVSKPRKHDTLESTWKAITERRHMPLTRHMKKSETWENHERQIDLLDDDFSSPPCPAPVKKSETFKERTNHVSSPVVPNNKLKKEPSLSQDDLNRRVEAFINKFNEDMRLQRQQSMQQFMEMINRAT